MPLGRRFRRFARIGAPALALAQRRAAEALRTAGRVGYISQEAGTAKEIVVDPTTLSITHVTFDCGITIGRDVALPSNVIKDMNSESILIELERNDLKDLPVHYI